MEESLNTDFVHMGIKENIVCNQIVITDITSSTNSLNSNSPPISPQGNTLLELPDAPDDKETVVEGDKTNGSRDETDAHIDTLQIPQSNTENTPLLLHDTGLLAYAPKWFRNICLTPYGILFFLCWASTMQVNQM